MKCNVDKTTETVINCKLIRPYHAVALFLRHRVALHDVAGKSSRVIYYFGLVSIMVTCIVSTVVYVYRVHSRHHITLANLTAEEN